MLFLSLFTPAAPAGGPPSAEHMAEMGRLIETMSKAGVLVATGGIKSRSTAMKVARRQDRFTVEDGPITGSSLMPAAGYALLRASSREELARQVQKFLQIAGDGTCEIIEIFDQPQEECAAA